MLNTKVLSIIFLGGLCIFLLLDKLLDDKINKYVSFIKGLINIGGVILSTAFGLFLQLDWFLENSEIIGKEYFKLNIDIKYTVFEMISILFFMYFDYQLSKKRHKWYLYLIKLIQFIFMVSSVMIIVPIFLGKIFSTNYRTVVPIDNTIFFGIGIVTSFIAIIHAFDSSLFKYENTK